MSLEVPQAHGQRSAAAALPVALLLLLLAGLTSAAAAPAATAKTSATPTRACPTLLQHRQPRLQDERLVDLCAHAGKVVLVVNTASHCGYTPQYQALEALHQRYAARGLVVMGFPSNDFGGQEPAGNAAIADFCENQFAVRFPMFAKSVVRASPRAGAAAVNPLFAGLAANSGQAPGWNFHKYLISRSGEEVISHASAVSPQDPSIIRDIERLLEAK
jgi:glutathione peroxidase